MISVMNREFIIFEDSVHAKVFLVQATDERQALKLYLEREKNYVEQNDGTYRSGPWTHESLEEALSNYGIFSCGDGSYSSTDDSTYWSLEQVKAAYGIEEQSNGTYISHDISYPDLTAALSQTIGHHHFEIAPCKIDLLATFQEIFISRDKWDYVEDCSIEHLKSDIVSQHLWQAERYKTLGQMKEAAVELKKALKFVGIRKEKLSILIDLAWILRSLGLFTTAVRKYKDALHIATEYDNAAWIRYRLAEVYEEAGQPSKALWHYKRIYLDDLDTEDINKMIKRIGELQQAALVTKTG